MWKTTDRYVQQKRVKAVEAESKLKQVYIPNYAKPNAVSGIANATGGGNVLPSGKSVMNGNSVPPSSNGNNNDVITINGGKPCESCAETTSPQVRLSFSRSLFLFAIVSNTNFCCCCTVVRLGTNASLPNMLDVLEEIWRP